MLHSDVRRTALGLSAVFTAAVAAFVLAVAEREAPHASAIEPAQSFERDCARCHSVDELRGILDDADDRTELALEWLEWLRSHGSSDDRADLALVKWLASER
jgi:mono/diheme cytochrome c family protein